MVPRLILSITLSLLLAEGASACRGPFSAAAYFTLEPHDQAFVGTVVSVKKGKLERAGTPYAHVPELTTIAVTRAWGKNQSATLVFTGVSLQVGGEGEQCVKSISPRVGEEWLVVGVPLRGGGFLARDGRSFLTRSPDGISAIAALTKKRGAGTLLTTRP